MSDSSAFDFGKFVPGFDFLQQLAQAGTSSARTGATPRPGLGDWVAPTVSVDELDKRIHELKAVQFWLEQNGTAVKATIQALEVQKLTLATLAGMNLSVAEITKAFTLPTPSPASEAAPVQKARGGDASPWPYAAPASQPAESAAPGTDAEEASQNAPELEATQQENTREKRASASKNRVSPVGGAAAAGLADPLKWWEALTQQFQQIASNAMREAVQAVPPAGTAAAGTPVAAENVAPAVASARKTAQASAGSAARKSPARKKKAAAPKTAARKSAAKRPAAASKSKSGPAVSRKVAPGAAGRKAAAAPANLLGWPLPPPFKMSR